MKVVKVKHYEKYCYELFDMEHTYLFETPIVLKEGDIVLTAPKQGKYENIAICVSDSAEISQKALEYLEGVGEYALPLAKVVGKYELERFPEYAKGGLIKNE